MSPVIEADPRRFSVFVVLGVGGAPPAKFATLPMNHDWARCKSGARGIIDTQ